MEQVVRLQKLADFYHGAMDDRIGDNGAEQGGLELSTLLEVLRPFAARLGKSEVGARGHAPGVWSTGSTSSMKPACADASGSGSAAACPDTVCNSWACLAAADMPCP
jgi:hypothetical protein